MQPCNHATCPARTGRPGVAALILPATRLAGVKKSFSFFFAMKYTRIPQERKKEHAHDEQIRENCAKMVRSAVTTNNLAAQQDPEERTVANGRRSSLSRFYSARSQCSTEVLTIARIHGAINVFYGAISILFATVVVIRIESNGLTCRISRLQCTRKCNLATCSARTGCPGVAALILPAKRLARVKNRFPFFRDETHNTL